MNAGEQKWKQVPKLHYMIAHVQRQAKLINQVNVQRYCVESMGGTLSEFFQELLFRSAP
jgi:hypothetical protein